jgi:hypothetical protein
MTTFVFALVLGVMIGGYFGWRKGQRYARSKLIEIEMREGYVGMKQNLGIE